MWRETTKHEHDMKIWKEELEDFIPGKVLDFHTHIFCKGVIPEGTSYCCAGQDIEKYDMDDLKRDLSEIYPERETYAVCFGMPYEEYDRELNDHYVGAQCDRKRFFPFRLIDPRYDTQANVKEDIDRYSFLGFKPYLNYVKKRDRNDIEIHEMLPDWAMEIAEEHGLIIMLHIPRKDRLADPINQKQIIEICNDYPNAKIVLAHIGRAYYLKGIVGYLDTLKSLPNLWYDLAMLNNWEVMEYLFRTVSAEKILYATDLPIAIAPGKSVEINDQYTYVTPKPWQLSISAEHTTLVFTSFLYEELRAIKKAVERSGVNKAFTQKIFFDNGITLLRDTMRIHETPKE
ncbi:MAG: amidohydrolase family protein [Lentisphaerae bacterium]|nr:amidohydrolase family protein [Lentisphaerota bacterium]